MLRPWLELARISNLPTVWTNVLAAWLLTTPDGRVWDTRLLFLLIGGSLLYTGGMILNDAADVRFDRQHRPERPIPSGRIGLSTVWTVGALMILAGAAVAVVLGGASLWVTCALAAAILFYDLYHKPWPGAVVVMALCRVLLYLMAASGLVGAGWRENAPLAISALGLGAYIVGLTQLARMEGKKQTSPAAAAFIEVLLYAPGITATALLFSSGRLRPVAILGDLTPLAPLIIVFTFAAWVTYAARLMRRGGPAIGQAVGLLLAGIPIVDALAVSQVSFPLALGFVALAPLLRYWQRWVAAT